MVYDEKLKQYCIRHKITKGQLLSLVYGHNYQGIDSALPQEYVRMHDMFYGHNNPRQDIFFYCVNYNNNRFGEIEYIPDIAEKSYIVI